MASRPEQLTDSRATGRSQMIDNDPGKTAPTARRRPLPLRFAAAAMRWTAKSTRDFSYRALHLTLYVAVVAGVALWVIQLPAVKLLLKEKVAHARDKYVLDGEGGSSGRTPADLQARLDGIEN